MDGLRTWDQYATRWAGLHGGVDPRSGSASVEHWLRMSYRIGRLLARIKVKPSLLTTAGLVCNALVVIVTAQHRFWPIVAAGLVVLSGIMDTLDGTVAVITNRVTRLGYVYDSVADRLGEAAWVAALWLIGAPGWLAVLVGGLAWLHEYLRARATAAGMAEIGIVTLGERPSRLILIVIGLVLSGVSGLVAIDLPAGTATIVAAVFVLLGVVGLIQLLGAVQTALTGPPRGYREPPQS
ncbi:CDP-alcohol phosphatidyltransferase family protein [Rugosimonospora acidiphila]|uniref:CDP-alcohol phosphatidyltransferase family protein n=1 Tax=Rugosimonospora acidiphila TaxID=556531 RepID=A0ABP9RR33_9ACTN